MPIERDRYPSDWDAIALRIKRDAGWCCQHCGRPCRMPGESVADLLDRLDGAWLIDILSEVDDLEFGLIQAPIHHGRFILTVAHMDQNPGNNAPENLAALCAPCHLKHDRPFRQFNRMAKRERRGQLNLFQGGHYAT